MVGEVVSLNEKLSWYEKKPLFGANICITRSREQSSNLKNKLQDLGAEVTEINSIKRKSTVDNLNEVKKKIDKYDHIILTSVNGVNMFFDYLIKEKIDIRTIRANFSVIGKATRKALEARGVMPFIMAREFVGEGLFKVLNPYLKKGENVLIPCSSSSREYLKEEIEALGLNVDRVHATLVYSMRYEKQKALEEVDYVLFTSPSTVHNMINVFGKEEISRESSLAIGRQTAKALKSNDISLLYLQKAFRRRIFGRNNRYKGGI